MVEGGVLNLGNGRGLPVYPNIQYWDYAARHIADAAAAARRVGQPRKRPLASAGSSAQLKAELDRMVPEYQAARRGAAHFFNANDALEAGQQFLRSTHPIEEARRALARMNAADRQLFGEGFASNLVDAIERTGDRRNVVNAIFGSQSAREKIRLALGDARANQLEAMLRHETIMDMMRGALGNSTTARQLIEYGTLGLGGGYSATHNDPTALPARFSPQASAGARAR
jgi:hypothetical protein